MKKYDFILQSDGKFFKYLYIGLAIKVAISLCIAFVIWFRKFLIKNDLVEFFQYFLICVFFFIVWFVWYKMEQDTISKDDKK